MNNFRMGVDIFLLNLIKNYWSYAFSLDYEIFSFDSGFVKRFGFRSSYRKSAIGFGNYPKTMNETVERYELRNRRTKPFSILTVWV
jgi:hypothetical protein